MFFFLNIEMGLIIIKYRQEAVYFHSRKMLQLRFNLFHYYLFCYFSFVISAPLTLRPYGAIQICLLLLLLLLLLFINVIVPFCAGACIYTMLGGVDVVSKNAWSFYGSRRSWNGYCTRQAISVQQLGLKSKSRPTASSDKLTYGHTNGRKFRCSPLTFGSSDKVSAAVQQNGVQSSRRHCRYINMQVRRLPRHHFAAGGLNGVNGHSLSETKQRPAALLPSKPAIKKSLMEKTSSKNRESRVLISAELRNKADSKMKIMSSVQKSQHSAMDRSSNISDGDHKKTDGSDRLKRTDRAKLEKSFDEGRQLRNGRSLPECTDTPLEKAVVCAVERHEHNTKVKKYRSRSLSPARPLAICRPRRSANVKRSVSIEYFFVPYSA